MQSQRIGSGGATGPASRAAASRPARCSARPLGVRSALGIPPASRRPSFVPAAASGAGGGSLGGKGWDGSGGGGGGDDGSAAGGGGPKGGGGAAAFPLLAGWRDRVAYDPEFPFKVMLEQVIGVGASVVGDMSSRPNWGLNELDFVFATLVVGSVVNFSLMYLLAPTAPGAAAGGGIIQRLLSDEFLKKWGAPGGNMFEKGFPVHARLVNFAYKGVTFAVIGMMAGIVGTSISNGLLLLRQKLDPAYIPQNEAPSVLGNAACWSLHMGISSNLRYQMLGGADAILVNVMPKGVFRGYSAVIRALNNVVGGISFVVIARMFGVQKAAAPAEPATAKA